jgi:hypothetical protein
MARDVATMFDELKALSDKHIELHVERTRLRGRMKIHVESSHKAVGNLADHAARGSAGGFLAKLTDAEVRRWRVTASTWVTTCNGKPLLSSKVHLPGREPVGSKLLNKNVFFKDAAAPFLDAPAPYRPYDYFLHVSSSDPMPARTGT